MSADDRNGTPVAAIAAIALTSFGALLLELALTRLFSVVLFYHFAFLAISVALLGLGAGGVFAHLARERLARHSTRSLGSLLCLANALVIVVMLELVLHMQISAALAGRNFLMLSAIYLASAVPFFLTGVLFSVVFARAAARIPLLYGADLAGGALACLALIPSLNALGGPNTVLGASLVMLLASAAWAPDARARRRPLLALLPLGLLLIANLNGALIDVVYAKGGRHDRSRGVEYARWNAISRVEVIAHPDGARSLRIDADAGSAIMGVEPRDWRDSSDAVPTLVNALRPRGAYAIIGPGGGVDVLRALAAGSTNVTGIEINDIIVDDIMRGRYAAFCHHLYDRPEVRIHVGDGRSFIRGSTERYDVVQMTLVDTWASTSAGAYALSENTLYTVEAFREYLDHLKPDGMLAVTRWEFRRPREALRVVSVAMEALRSMGVRDPAGHFLVFSEGPLDEDGRAVIVLTKRSAFTAEEEAAARGFAARHPRVVPLYVPWAPGLNEFSALIASGDPRAFARGYEFNVAPATDDSPFFFFTLNLRQILTTPRAARGIDWRVNLGVAVLAAVLVISTAAVVAFLLLPLLLQKRSRPRSASPLLYFVAVGLGFILVEIAFVQRFVLFLGHPSHALTVVIFLLLLSSGTGSILSRRFLAQPARARWVPAGLALALGGCAFVLPTVLSSLAGLGFAAKLLVGAGILVPLGLAMGVPFPVGLSALAPVATRGEVEWAWAVNAAASVLGSVLAVAIAVNFGLTWTLACGAVAYAAAFLAMGRLRSRADQVVAESAA